MESKDIESKDWAYHKLSPIRKWKLSEFFENLVNKISIVYSNKDFQDIQIAVEKSLQKVVAKMNKRGIFRISRIQPCGSMAEKTSIWKWGRWQEKYYTELDFLAVLDEPVNYHCERDQMMQDQNDCPMCTCVKIPPFKHIPTRQCHLRPR